MCLPIYAVWIAVPREKVNYVADVKIRLLLDNKECDMSRLC